MTFIKSIYLLYYPANLSSFKTQKLPCGVHLVLFLQFGRTICRISSKLLTDYSSDQDDYYVHLLQTVDLLHPRLSPLLSASLDDRFAFSLVLVLLRFTTLFHVLRQLQLLHHVSLPAQHGSGGHRQSA